MCTPHQKVSKLTSETRINDRCLDMQKAKKKTKAAKEAKGGGGLQSKSKRAKSGASCPYHVPAEAPESLDYRNQVLAAVSDIEDLRSLGKTHGVCPYYGSRRALGLAQIVTMPYSTLMHRRTRETLGLRLKGNVIIIDEAHNLVDAINNVHSSIVTLAHIGLALSQLTQYKDRYQARLNPKNLFYVNQLVAILKGFVKYLGVKKKKKKNTNKNHNNNTREEEEEERRKRRKGGEGIDVSSLSSSASSSSSSSVSGTGGKGGAGGASSADGDSQMMGINEFLVSTGIDHINMFKIERYMERSGIAKKIMGFVDRYIPTVDIYETRGAAGAGGVGGRGDRA